jgi:hypothetical protein
MELANSKRVLRSASYVTTELNEEEQRREEKRPGRALEKLNFIAQLDLTTADLRVLEEAAPPGSQLRKDLQRIVEISRGLTPHRPDPAAFMKLAQIAAAVSAASLTDIGKKVQSSMLPEKQQKLLTEVYEHSFRTAPVGRLHLERLEMYPAGMERGELMFTIPMAPRETITVSHKEWSTRADEYDSDPPPLKWSDLRYVFDIKEDCNGKEALQA